MSSRGPYRARWCGPQWAQCRRWGWGLSCAPSRRRRSVCPGRSRTGRSQSRSVPAGWRPARLQHHRHHEDDEDDGGDQTVRGSSSSRRCGYSATRGRLVSAWPCVLPSVSSQSPWLRLMSSRATEPQSHWLLQLLTKTTCNTTQHIVRLRAVVCRHSSPLLSQSF